MLAFRSEGEVRRWCDARGLPVGALFSPQTVWRLAGLWYGDRLDLDWRRSSVEERQRILARVGLVGEFWRI